MAWNTFRNSYTFSILDTLEYMADQVYGGPTNWSYSGDLSGNNEAAWNSITWMDARISVKPTWAEILIHEANQVWILKATFLSYGNWMDTIYPNEVLPRALSTTVATALAGKASASHTHLVSEITDLSTELAKYALGNGLLIEKRTLTTDANSRITCHVTVDSLSTGTAKWSTVNPPAIVILPKKGTTISGPVEVLNASEELWSNGNKTVTAVVNKATTLLVLGATAVAAGSGISVDVLIIGQKA